MIKLEQIHQVLAPQIIGNNIAKQLLFLQLFTRPSLGEKFNILMIGDTASAKTDLIDELRSFYFNSIFVGRNTTSAGLFGAVRGSRLVGGAIHQVHNGIVYMDELDKLDNSVKKDLIQLMDKYDIVITKAGMQFPITTKANYTATANPIGGDWIGEPNTSQIPFSTILLNRFHMVIPFKSLKAEDYNKLKNSFTIKEDDDAKEKRILLLKEFITHSRKYDKIKVPEKFIHNAVEFIQALKEEYSQFLPLISPRQIDGFLTLMKASARMDLRTEVNQEDFKQIKNFFMCATKLWMQDRM